MALVTVKIIALVVMSYWGDGRTSITALQMNTMEECAFAANNIITAPAGVWEDGVITVKATCQVYTTDIELDGRDA